MAGASPVPIPPPVSAVKEVSNAHTLSSKDIVDVRKGLRQGTMKLESIPMRLDAFDQLVEEEETHRASLESRLTLENARMEWNAYAALMDSNLVRIALTNAELRLEDKVLRAIVGTTIDQNNVKGEMARMLEVLRKRLHDNALRIEVILDEQKQAQQIQQPSRVARPLTAREKLDKMKEVNPAVEELIRRFDLKLGE